MNLKKNQRIGLAVLAVLVCLGLFFMIRRFSDGSSHAIGIAYVENETPSHWTASYYSLDGTMKKTLKVKDDVLMITTTTKRGVISILVKDKKGRVIFDEEDLGNATYSVGVAGKATVLIDADEHEGSFDIQG